MLFAYDSRRFRSKGVSRIESSAEPSSVDRVNTDWYIVGNGCNIPFDFSSSNFLVPTFAASSKLKEVTLPNSRNLNESNVKNRRRKSAQVSYCDRKKRKKKKKSSTPFANPPTQSKSSSVALLSPRTMTHVCSPVSSLVVCRTYRGTYPALFQKLRICQPGYVGLIETNSPKKLRGEPIRDTQIVEGLWFSLR